MTPREYDPYELAIGQALPRNAYNEKGQLLLRKGAIIHSSAQIELITENALASTAPETDRQAGVDDVPATPLGMLLTARWRLLALIEQGSNNFPADLLRVGALLRRACRANTDLALASVLLVRDAPYPIRHAANAAVICQIMAAALDWPEETQAAVVAAALTMNLGMLELQDELSREPGPLTPEQKETIHLHPTRSVELLQNAGVPAGAWLEIVRDHHERLDGSGYPAGKQADAISPPARLLALADIYCARITERSYRAGMSATPALRQIFLNEGKRVDEAQVAQFIKTLGVYPPGTGVRLENGSIAVVTHRGATGNTPRVAALTSPTGMQLASPLRHSSGSPGHAVKSVVNLEALKIPVGLTALWGTDAAL